MFIEQYVYEFFNIFCIFNLTLVITIKIYVEIPTNLLNIIVYLVIYSNIKSTI